MSLRLETFGVTVDGDPKYSLTRTLRGEKDYLGSIEPEPEVHHAYTLWLGRYGRTMPKGMPMYFDTGLFYPTLTDEDDTHSVSAFQMELLNRCRGWLALHGVEV